MIGSVVADTTTNVYTYPQSCCCKHCGKCRAGSSPSCCCPHCGQCDGPYQWTLNAMSNTTKTLIGHGSISNLGRQYVEAL